MHSSKNSPRPTVAEVLARLNDYPDFCDPVTDVNQLGTFGNRPLHLVSWQGNVDEIRTLVEGGAEVNVTGDMGPTPLHDASKAGQLAAVRILLQYGAKPDTTDEFGKTPRDWADLNRHSEIMKVLESHTDLDTGADQ
jgi:ankyrin repeat protein